MEKQEQRPGVPVATRLEPSLMARRIKAAAAVLSLCVAVSGCSVFGSETGQTASANSFDLGPEETGGIGVNAYLWRASLDTISFMPLVSADPWGGVIITDWYANPAKPDERFKATVYILDTRLRADGISVAIFREVRAGDGWQTAPVVADTGIAIENAILDRARQLRLANLEE
jgi:hypothetical protein